MKETITINFDGGSRGNPGPAGIGVVLSAEDGTPLVTLGKYIGRPTNNVAEYMAMILGFREAAKLARPGFTFVGTASWSLNGCGEYRVKIRRSSSCTISGQSLSDGFASVGFEHNLRHHNSLARSPRESGDGSQGGCRRCGRCSAQILLPGPIRRDFRVPLAVARSR